MQAANRKNKPNSKAQIPMSLSAKSGLFPFKAKDVVIKPGFAMTGELTLTGEVLAIGGLKEKIVAAKRVGVTKIIFPKDNEPHLKEIQDYVKKGVTFYPVSHYREVESLLF